MEFPSISSLIPKLRSGDEATWNTVVDTFQAGLISRARQLLKGAQIQRVVAPEDLVSETIERAWQKRETFEGATTAQFAAWVLQIQKNLFIDRCRPSRPEDSIVSWFDPLAPDTIPPERVLRNEQESMLHACLAEMSEEYRVVICLKHLEELKYKEIAERLDVTTGAVAGIYRRAMRSLKECLRVRLG